MEIMLCIQWSEIIFLYGLVSLVFSLTPKSMETRELYIVLNSDGTLKYPSIVPDCGIGKKIFLISYSYQQVQCDTDCYSIHEEPLLPADIMLLHEMCSLREKCYTLNFTARSGEQTKRTNSVRIYFRCLDLTSTSIDICKPCTVFFNDTLYLTTSDDSARQYILCECFLNVDNFSIKAEDVRLNSIQEKKCTNASVHINSQDFRCDPEKRNFGSVFNRTVIKSDSNAFLSLKHAPKSTTEFPSMVLISVSPQKTSRIVCIPKQPRSGEISVESTAKLEISSSVEQVLTTDSIIYQATEQSASSTNFERPFLPAFIVITVCFIPLALLVSTYCILRCFKNKGCYKTKEDEEQTERLQPPAILRSASGTSGNGSRSNSNELSEVRGESISSAAVVNPDNSPTNTTLNPTSSQRSDMLQKSIATCHTTSQSFMSDPVRTATLGGAPSEIQLQEEKRNDVELGDDPPIYIHDLLLPDETEDK